MSAAAPTDVSRPATGGRPHRGTILLEDAAVLAHSHFDAGQHVLRLAAPRCAALATPGSFVHLRCGPQLPMRRPLSIMRAHAAEGWIEVLYKVVGAGTRALAAVQPQYTLSVLGPIGRGFDLHPQPMNRGIEIASAIADGPQSVIRAQVSNGVAVRMAVLESVAGALAS